jgi:hypothetical protein
MELRLQLAKERELRTILERDKLALSSRLHAALSELTTARHELARAVPSARTPLGASARFGAASGAEPRPRLGPRASTAEQRSAGGRGESLEALRANVEEDIRYVNLKFDSLKTRVGSCSGQRWAGAGEADDTLSHSDGASDSDSPRDEGVAARVGEARAHNSQLERKIRSLENSRSASRRGLAQVVKVMHPASPGKHSGWASPDAAAANENRQRSD